ncbi:hypothetical protein [Nocardioides okcheonensis]|uniref:hypothetical protein n=1 Tax=Nocardioides okcheonensis TaxID=2894081 RepID=UPI001E4DEAC8|nr:hypothetical protein [Nocardioides okcheonensis]UFN42701.1 hypothetical protein LN652_11565 [Nocardioides okcheonensis]
MDHRADDYAPGRRDRRPAADPAVGGRPGSPPAAEQPAEPAEPAAEPAEPASEGKPLLPRRTPGSNDMPGKPIEQTDGGGGWFTRKEPPAAP